VVCGFGVPPYDLLNLYGVLTASFATETAEKQLDLKSLYGWTKTEELRTPDLELLSLRLSL
jgi:hypothetical protein